MAQAVTHTDGRDARTRAAHGARLAPGSAAAPRSATVASSAADREAAHAARHRGAVRRGVWMGIAITVPLVFVAAAVSYVSGSPSRYLAIAIGLAAGASMATHVIDRCHRAGLAAVAVTALALLLMVPLSCFSCVAAEGGQPFAGMVDHVAANGVGGLFAHYAAGEPWRALAAMGASLAIAYLTGRGLGDGRLLGRLVRS